MSNSDHWMQMLVRELPEAAFFALSLALWLAFLTLLFWKPTSNGPTWTRNLPPITQRYDFTAQR